MLVLPNDWVEGSRCSPPVSNDDTAQSAPRICVVCIRGFFALEHSIHIGFHATGLTNKRQMEAPLLTAPVFGIQHRGCEGHAVGYCDACGKASDRGHGGFEQFHIRVCRNIFIQEYPFV